MSLLRMPLEDKTTHFALSRPGMIPKLTCLIGIVLIDMVIILPNYTGLAGVGAQYLNINIQETNSRAELVKPSLHILLHDAFADLI